MKRDKKTIIYQLMPRWFTNLNENCVSNGTIRQNGCGKFNEIDESTLRSIKSLGATHVWYTGVIEHATTTDYSSHGITPCNPHVVKGNAGSPYAIRDYYDVCPDMAIKVNNRMAEFETLVDRTHQVGLKVIIDFVPNHVAREYESDSKPTGVQDLGEGDNPMMFFDPKNNFYYITGQEFAPNGVDLGQGEKAYHEFPARATGNDCYTASPNRDDWYETVKLNYGIDPWNGSTHFDPIPPTWLKILNILKFWTAKGVDGFRCDMAHMVPVAFWQWAIRQIKSINSDIIFIAEIYDVALYRSYIFDGGFDYWSVPTLRRWHQKKPTSEERRLRAFYRKLMGLCNSEKTLARGYFFDLMYVNQDTLDTRCQYAYLRHCEGEMTLIVVNFGDQDVNTAIRIPQHALDCAHMPYDTYLCKELLTGSTSTIRLDDESLIPIHVTAHDAVLWHFK